MKSPATPPPALTAQELLSELHALVADAEKMLGDNLTEHAESAVSALRDRFASAQKRMGELYHTASVRVAAGAQCTDQAIRANPYQSMAIAAGVGLLAGILLGRRSR